MNSDTPFTTHGDEALEARIVSWVLGEASAFEAAELERLCEERPELMVFKRRMQVLHGLLADAEIAQADDSWKLPPEKRKALEDIFGEEKAVRLEVEKEQRIRHSGRRALLAIAACLAISVIAIRFIVPWKHESQAIIEVRPRGGGLSPLGESVSSDKVGGMTPQFFSTEFEKIKSRHNLEKVVENLDLAERWNVDKDEALKILRSSVKTRNVRGTDLISIDVKSPNQQDADDIARELAFSYKSYREEVERRDAERQLHELNKAVRDQEDKVEERRKVLANIVRTKGIINKGDDSFYGQDEGVKAMRDESREEAIKRGLDAQDYADAKRQFEADQELLQTMKIKQMGETIAGRIPGGSVVFHELPPESGARENKNPLAKRVPPPRYAPAPSASIAGQIAPKDSDAAAKRERQVPVEETASAPDSIRSKKIVTYTASPAALPVPEVDVAMPSIDFSRADDFGNGWGGEALAGAMGSDSQTAAKQPAAKPAVTTAPRQTSTRSELLAEVDSDWKMSVPADEERLKEIDAITAKIADLDEVKRKVEAALEADPSDARALEVRDMISKLEQSKELVIQKPNLTKLTEEIPAAEDPYSTFSLNISDASFQVAQAALAKGEQPDPAGIKVEQFYNAVDYGDPAPSADEPVAVSIEQSAHPVIPGRNLVRIALKTAAAGRSASQPLRLTLLVDQSGSMVREDRQAAMGKALAGLSGLLTKDDLVTVIGFARTPRLLADAMTGDKAGKLADLVNQSASEGGTNLEEAIKLAEQMADRRKHTGAQNRIVLFTDGAANLGNADPAKLAEKVRQLRQKGIAFDIAGIAVADLNDELLGELARNGNGRYYIVGKGEDSDFAKQLAGAFRPAAENVKVQVRFNPERVGRYKLIGFEKDRLKTEDFRNDAVDAAELAAEEAGVAIYQVEPLPEGRGELGEVSVRFRDTASQEMVERTWTIPHDAATPAFDRAAPSMQLAVLAMLAGEKLKGGPLADAIDFKQLAEPQANVKRFYGSSGRVAEVLRMVDALK